MRRLRRLTAGVLALAGLWLALGPAGGGAEVSLLEKLALEESPILARWMAEQREPEPPMESPQPEAPEPAPTVPAAPLPGDGAAILNRTELAVDPEAAIQAGTSLQLSPADRGPQILIMHTHTTESYARDPDAPYTETGEAHTTDTGYNIVQVGQAITDVLTEMGFSVLHDTQVYDWPSYNGAYQRSRAGVEAILAQYPTVQMVLDVHRDAMVDGEGRVCRPSARADGAEAAQVMLLVGTDAGGAVFPDWPEHLALALEVSREMNALWPGLARPVTLRTARFNQQLTKGSLLVEVGSHGNTLEEAVRGGRLFARALGRVLEGYVVNE